MQKSKLETKQLLQPKRKAETATTLVLRLQGDSSHKHKIRMEINTQTHTQLLADLKEKKMAISFDQYIHQGKLYFVNCWGPILIGEVMNEGHFLLLLLRILLVLICYETRKEIINDDFSF